jgi:2-polyprenyl-3-methyl-5-hydroxy-6-metoxy-1,4-benzoquinol methylase
MKEPFARPPQIATTYDAMYRSGGHEGVYELPYRRSRYYPLFRAVLAELRRRDARSLLEVGCGVGTFASMLFEKSEIAYAGFDFSPVAVDTAIKRTGRADAFYVGDATTASSYARDYATIVCTEVLEHIESDRRAVELWRPGTDCICSVPNFDSSTHVRYFSSENDVRQRYGDLIDIRSIHRIKLPALTDLSSRSYLQAIRWNRYRPKRLLDIFGFSSFDEGGWFLFAGTRRAA